jgi:hypothetical protein
MKPAGYLLTRKDGAKSGTAHRCTVDFWLGKDDHVQPMYTHEDVIKMLYSLLDDPDLIPDLIFNMSISQKFLIQEIEHTKKVLSEKKQQPRVAGAVIP